MGSYSFAAVVPAAGSSNRMGSSGSKLLEELGGLTVLSRTLRGLLACTILSEIVIPCRPVDREGILRSLAAVNPSIPIQLIDGGRVRQESVLKGLEYLESKTSNAKSVVVAIHDAARCFVTGDLVQAALMGAAEYGAVTTGVKLADSIKKVSHNGEVECSLSREDVWCIQTPQAFRLDIVLKAHREALLRADDTGATDDSSLVETSHSVRMIAGENINFKVTTPQDLELAAAIVKAQSN